LRTLGAKPADCKQVCSSKKFPLSEGVPVGITVKAVIGFATKEKPNGPFNP
jgi:hypothetical protein